MYLCSITHKRTPIEDILGGLSTSTLCLEVAMSSGYHNLDEGTVDPAAQRLDGSMQTILVRVPPGATPGQTMQGRSPEGIAFMFTVPEDASSMVKVQVPRNRPSESMEDGKMKVCATLPPPYQARA